MGGRAAARSPVTVTDVTRDADGNLLVIANVTEVGTTIAKLDPTTEGACQWLVHASSGAERRGKAAVAADGEIIVVGADQPIDGMTIEAPVARLSPRDEAWLLR